VQEFRLGDIRKISGLGSTEGPFVVVSKVERAIGRNQVIRADAVARTIPDGVEKIAFVSLAGMVRVGQLIQCIMRVVGLSVLERVHVRYPAGEVVGVIVRGSARATLLVIQVR